MDDMDRIRDQNEELQAENAKLKERLARYEARSARQTGVMAWILAKLAGPGVRSALDEWKHGVGRWQEKPSFERLPLSEGSELAISLFVRFVRVGTFALIAALLPVVFLSAQTYLMKVQNDRLTSQNELLESQNTQLVTQTAVSVATLDRTLREMLGGPSGIVPAAYMTVDAPAVMVPALTALLADTVFSRAALEAIVRSVELGGQQIRRIVGDQPPPGAALMSLRDMDLSGLGDARILSNASISEVFDVQFGSLDLSGTRFYDAMANVDFSGAHLEGAEFILPEWRLGVCLGAQPHDEPVVLRVRLDEYETELADAIEEFLAPYEVSPPHPSPIIVEAIVPRGVLIEPFGLNQCGAP